MIVLHALWSRDAELCVWGERSSLPPRSRDERGIRPGGSPRHPFAAAAALLVEALGQLGVSAAARRSRRCQLGLRLPSNELGPQPSPQLLRLAEEGDGGPLRLEAWELDAIALEPSAAVDLLLALPARPPVGLVLGESLQYLAEVCKLALELVARGRLRPALERRGERWAALWLPVLDEPVDRHRVGLLVRAMPPLLRAELGPWEAGRRPDRILEGFIASTVDACAREFLGGQLATIDGVEGPIAGALEAWLLALVDEDPLVDGDPWELAMLAERLEQWWEASRSYAAQRMFRTCFRLVPPGEDEEPAGAGAGGELDDEADGGLDGERSLPALRGVSGDAPGGEVWRVEFLLQHKEDPSVLVPAADVWAHSERLEALGHAREPPGAAARRPWPCPAAVA